MRAYGRPTGPASVSIELTEADLPVLPMATRSEPRKSRNKKSYSLSRADAHPVVKQALEMFGAELADVRTKSPTNKRSARNEKSSRQHGEHHETGAQQMQAQMAKLQEEAATKAVSRLGRRRHGYGDSERRAGGCQRPYRS